MGTGYTTLDPRRRKFPPTIYTDADDAEMVATDLGDGSPIPASSRAAERGSVDDREGRSTERSS